MACGLMTEDEVRDLIRQKCTELGGQSAFARTCGVQPQFISMVLTGKRAPSDVILEAVGVEDAGRRYIRTDTARKGKGNP